MHGSRSQVEPPRDSARAQDLADGGCAQVTTPCRSALESALALPPTRRGVPPDKVHSALQPDPTEPLP